MNGHSGSFMPDLLVSSTFFLSFLGKVCRSWFLTSTMLSLHFRGVRENCCPFLSTNKRWWSPFNFWSCHPGSLLSCLTRCLPQIHLVQVVVGPSTPLSSWTFTKKWSKEVCLTPGGLNHTPLWSSTPNWPHALRTVWRPSDSWCHFDLYKPHKPTHFSPDLDNAALMFDDQMIE